MIFVLESKCDPVIRKAPKGLRETVVEFFVGQPLIHQGQVPGVLGVFLRVPVIEGGLMWLRMIADHAAVTIANTPALEEIKRLQTQLELENEYLRDEVKAAHEFGKIIGNGPSLQKVWSKFSLSLRPIRTYSSRGKRESVKS